jgi:hypothetical protein
MLRTESRIDCGLGAAGFSDHDGNGWVGLLHGGVASGEEVPASLHQLRLLFSPSVVCNRICDSHAWASCIVEAHTVSQRYAR